MKWGMGREIREEVLPLIDTRDPLKILSRNLPEKNLSFKEYMILSFQLWLSCLKTKRSVTIISITSLIG